MLQSIQSFSLCVDSSLQRVKLTEVSGDYTIYGTVLALHYQHLGLSKDYLETYQESFN